MYIVGIQWFDSFIAVISLNQQLCYTLRVTIKIQAADSSFFTIYIIRYILNF